MAHIDGVYRRLIESILRIGAPRQSRAGNTISYFGTAIVTDNYSEFPLLTTRKIHTKGIVGELAAFLTGSTLLSTFKENGCNYWDANAAAWPANAGLPIDAHKVGRIYGTQWRSWRGQNLTTYDQMEAFVKGIKADPFGRRHILTTWNPGDLSEMCLPPCHLLAQFYVRGRRLDCLVFMRSVDLALGLPSDLVLYGLLQRLVAQACNLESGLLNFHFGDTHIYENHVDQLQEQIARTPYETAKIELDPNATPFNFSPTAVEFIDYKYQEPEIKYALNV